MRQKNWIYNIETETADHFLLKDLFGNCPEYGVVVDRRDNLFCSFGIKLANELKSILKVFLPNTNLLVKPQHGMYDINRIRRSRDTKLSFAIANKFRLPFSLWCNTRGEIKNTESTLKTYNLTGIPKTKLFSDYSRYGVLSYSLPLFSDYCFMKRDYKYGVDLTKKTIQHVKVLNHILAFFILLKLFKAKQTSYLTTIKSLRYTLIDPEYTIYVEWDIQNRTQEKLDLYFGSRLRGSIYKPYAYYAFSGKYFCEEFKNKQKYFQEQLNEELNTNS